MFFWNSCFFCDPTGVGNLIYGSIKMSKLVISRSLALPWNVAHTSALPSLSVSLFFCILTSSVWNVKFYKPTHYTFIHVSQDSLSTAPPKQIKGQIKCWVSLNPDPSVCIKTALFLFICRAENVGIPYAIWLLGVSDETVRVKCVGTNYVQNKC